jgi:hypothetical protein
MTDRSLFDLICPATPCRLGDKLDLTLNQLQSFMNEVDEQSEDRSVVISPEPASMFCARDGKNSNDDPVDDVKSSPQFHDYDTILKSGWIGSKSACPTPHVELRRQQEDVCTVYWFCMQLVDRIVEVAPLRSQLRLATERVQVDDQLINSIKSDNEIRNQFLTDIQVSFMI